MFLYVVSIVSLLEMLWIKMWKIQFFSFYCFAPQAYINHVVVYHKLFMYLLGFILPLQSKKTVFYLPSLQCQIETQKE